MSHREQKSVGPMSNQRAQDFVISPALPRMPTASEPGCDAPCEGEDQPPTITEDAAGSTKRPERLIARIDFAIEGLQI
jgi:hypothetical protein